MVLAHTSHASSPTMSRTGFYPPNNPVPLGVLGRSLPPTKLLPCSKEAKSPCPITGRLGLVASLLLSRHGKERTNKPTRVQLAKLAKSYKITIKTMNIEDL